MGENIYEDKVPILFAEDNELNEYRGKQNEKTKKLLEATESENVTEFLVKLVYGEDFNLPVRLLDTKVEGHGERVLELAKAIEKIDSYNEFRGEQAASAVRALHNSRYIMETKLG